MLHAASIEKFPESLLRLASLEWTCHSNPLESVPQSPVVWRLTCLCFTYCFVWGPCFKLMCEVKYTYVDTFRNTFRCSYIKIVKVRWAGIGYRRVDLSTRLLRHWALHHCRLCCGGGAGTETKQSVFASRRFRCFRCCRYETRLLTWVTTSFSRHICKVCQNEQRNSWLHLLHLPCDCVYFFTRKRCLVKWKENDSGKLRAEAVSCPVLFDLAFEFHEVADFMNDQPSLHAAMKHINWTFEILKCTEAVCRWLLEMNPDVQGWQPHFAVRQLFHSLFCNFLIFGYFWSSWAKDPSRIRSSKSGSPREGLL